MAGPDALFCKMVEDSFYLTKKGLDWSLDKAKIEKWVKKVLSFCYRYTNTAFKLIFDELNYWSVQIAEMKRLILKAKYAKNLKRICLDMMKCIALYELVAGKEAFGNKTVKELSSPEEFEKFVCNGGWLKQAEYWLQKQIDFVKGKIQEIKSFIDGAVMTAFNFIVKGYDTALAGANIPTFLEKLDTITGCVFGLCSIGNTVTNYKDDIVDRLYITPNGRANRARFRAILMSGINKIDEKMNEMGQDLIATQDQWTKIAKNAISHNLPA